MSEEARVQNAQAQGAAFMFGAQENRDVATLNRMSGQQSQARQDMANANMAGAQSTAGMIGGITSTIGGVMSSGAFAQGGSLAGGGAGGANSSNNYNQPPGYNPTTTNTFGGYTGNEYNNITPFGG